MYILDNEPTLWSETHRDVHPEPVSYDELLDRTIAYATEIRRADPEALIAGPALWGFPACFSSGVDKAAYPAHPDRDRHGGVALLPWWLGEVAAHEKRAGIRLIDLVDVHFYPQGRGIGVGAAGETDPDTAARRIRATRALWDPTYVDESWIADRGPPHPSPRRRGSPRSTRGSAISIGEYNFGAEEHMSGGLAVAEALGRFGERGDHVGVLLGLSRQGLAGFWAFRAYRDFDGAAGGSSTSRCRPSRAIPSRRSSPRATRAASTWSSCCSTSTPSDPFDARIDTSSCGRVVGAAPVRVRGRAAAGFAPASAEPEGCGVAPSRCRPIRSRSWTCIWLPDHERRT